MSARRCTTTGCDCTSESSRTASLRTPVRSSRWEPPLPPPPSPSVPANKRSYLDTLGYAPGFAPRASYGGGRDPRFTAPPPRGNTSRYLHSYSPQVPSPLRIAADNDHYHFHSYSRYRSAYQARPPQRHPLPPAAFSPVARPLYPSSTYTTSRLRPGDIGYSASASPSPSSSYSTPTTRLLLFPSTSASTNPSPKPAKPHPQPSKPRPKRPAPPPTHEPNGYHMQGTSKYHCLSRGAYRQKGALIHCKAWYEAQFGRRPSALEKGKWKEEESAPLSGAERAEQKKKEEKEKKKERRKKKWRGVDGDGEKGMGSTYRAWKKNQEERLLCKVEEEISFTFPGGDDNNDDGDENDDVEVLSRQRLRDDYHHDLQELADYTEHGIAKPRRRLRRSKTHDGRDGWHSESKSNSQSRHAGAFPEYQDMLNPPPPPHRPRRSSSKHALLTQEKMITPQPPRKSRKANLGFGIGIFRRWTSGSDKNKARDSSNSDAHVPSEGAERKKSGKSETSSESKKPSTSKTSSESKKSAKSRASSERQQGSESDPTYPKKTSTSSETKRSSESNKRPSFSFFQRFSWNGNGHTSRYTTTTTPPSPEEAEEAEEQAGKQKIREITEHQWLRKNWDLRGRTGSV